MHRDAPASPAPNVPGERQLGLLAVLVIFNVILSNSFQEALFLTHHRRTDIPLAMFLGSLVAAAAATITNRLLRVLAPASALRLVLMSLGLCSALQALWNRHPGPASTFALFLFVELSTTLGFAITWTYFQAPLSPSQTRRLMPRLSGLSGIGGLLAGALVPLLMLAKKSHFLGPAQALGPPQILIVISAATWLLCAALVRSSHAPSLRRGPRYTPQPSGAGPWLRVPLLTVLIAGTALVIWAGLLLQYETRVVLKDRLRPEDIAPLMALLLGSASVIGIAIQLFLAPLILERFGVGLALAVLPAATLALVTGYLVLPALPLITGAFWADKTLRANLNRPAESCLLAALSPAIRPRITLTLTGVLTPLLKATGALALWGLQPWIRPGALLLPVLCMAAVLLVLSRHWGSLYALALSRTLEEASVDAPDEALAHTDPGTQGALQLLDGPRLAILLKAMDRGSARTRQLALDLLRPHRSALVRRAMHDRLDHPHHAVREAALRWFAAAPPDAELLLHLRRAWQGSRRERERLAILEAAGSSAPTLLLPHPDSWIETRDLGLRQGVLRVLLGAPDPSTSAKAYTAVERLLSSAAPQERCAGLELAAGARVRDRDALLRQVLLRIQDMDAAVRRCALGSLSAFPVPAARAALLSALAVPAQAHIAVRTLGVMPDAIGEVLHALAMDSPPTAVRVALLRTAGLLADPRAIPVLLDHVDRYKDNPALALEALRTLNLVRREHPREWRRQVGRSSGARGAEERLRGFVLDEIRYGLHLMQCRDLVRPVLRGFGFLLRELEAQLERAQRRLLYALQLLSPPETLSHVFRALRSPTAPPAHKDQARELLRALFRERPVRAGSLKLLDETTVWSPECYRPPLGASVGKTGADAVRWLLQHGDGPMRWALIHDQDTPHALELLRLRAGAPLEDAMDPSLEMLIFLKDVVLFEALNNQQLATVARLAESVELPAGHVLFRQGDRPDYMYLVVRGKLQVRISNKEVARVGAGECTGEMGVLSGTPRSGTVVLLEQCRLLRFDGADFLELLDSYPEICRALLRSFMRRLVRAGGESPERLATLTGMAMNSEDGGITVRHLTRVPGEDSGRK